MKLRKREERDQEQMIQPLVGRLPPLLLRDEALLLELPPPVEKITLLPQPTDDPTQPPALPLPPTSTPRTPPTPPTPPTSHPLLFFHANTSPEEEEWAKTLL